MNTITINFTADFTNIKVDGKSNINISSGDNELFNAECSLDERDLNYVLQNVDGETIIDAAGKDKIFESLDFEELVEYFGINTLLDRIKETEG